MQEDEVIVLENGLKVCPDCIAGELKLLGGPIAVGIPGANDPNVLFLFNCDICNTLYKLKDEEYRQDIVRRHMHLPEYQALWNAN